MISCEFLITAVQTVSLYWFLLLVFWAVTTHKLFKNSHNRVISTEWRIFSLYTHTHTHLYYMEYCIESAWIMRRWRRRRRMFCSVLAVQLFFRALTGKTWAPRATSSSMRSHTHTHTAEWVGWREVRLFTLVLFLWEKKGSSWEQAQKSVIWHQTFLL